MDEEIMFGEWETLRKEINESCLNRGNEEGEYSNLDKKVKLDIY